MTLQDLLAELRMHNRSVQTLAALGAELQLRQDGVAGDPEVRELLRGVVEALDPALLDGLTKEQQSAALGSIRMYFRNALDLLERSGRVPGWNHTDPEMLEAQGQTSSAVVPRIEAIAAEHPDLAAATRRSGTLLDVGTGVGHLAITAARTWPALRVVGIDVWEPALALARARERRSKRCRRANRVARAERRGSRGNECFQLGVASCAVHSARRRRDRAGSPV